MTNAAIAAFSLSVIVIVSSIARERAAFAALCESAGWSSAGCDSVRSFVRLIHRTSPRVVIARHRLDDGFSDDVLAGLNKLRLLPSTKTIVLLGACTDATIDVRQVTLGADCIQRDPVRGDVLLAYLTKYFALSRRPRPDPEQEAAKIVPFADGILRVVERVVQRKDQIAFLTPREVALLELLIHSRGEVITYDTLYNEVLGRPFCGDTSNMRVLLGKLSATIRAIGISVPHWVEVLPKTGYRYRTSAATTADPAVAHN